LSERTDNPETEEEADMARVIDTDVGEDEDSDWVESESPDDWDELSTRELPARPRSRLLRPLPIALILLLIAAAGFLGGVLVQKGSGESGATAGLSGASGSLPAFLKEKIEGGAAGGTGTEAAAGGTEGAAAGAPSFGGGEAAATGTVSSVEGTTIYVKESDGTVVAVKAQDGSTVTRDSNVGAKKIHPGDTVVVEGSKQGSTVKASSIAATEAGVEASTAGGGFPGAATGAAGGEAEGGSVESLFGE
jgi:hypothetical protein